MSFWANARGRFSSTCLISAFVILFTGCIAAPEETPTITNSLSTSTSEPVVEKTKRSEVTTTSLPSNQITDEQLAESIRGELLGDLKKVMIGYKDDPGKIYIRWDLSTASENEKIIQYAQTDTATILRNCWESEASFYEVQVSGWYTHTVDINSNLEYTELIDLIYTKDKLDQVNWENVRGQYIWIIADGGSVHWLLEE